MTRVDCVGGVFNAVDMLTLLVGTVHSMVYAATGIDASTALTAATNDTLSTGLILVQPGPWVGTKIEMAMAGNGKNVAVSTTGADSATRTSLETVARNANASVLLLPLSKALFKVNTNAVDGTANAAVTDALKHGKLDTWRTHAQATRTNPVLLSGSDETDASSLTGAECGRETRTMHTHRAPPPHMHTQTHKSVKNRHEGS